MEDIKELEKRLEDLQEASHKVWEQYMNKALEGIPYDVAYKWYCNQPVIKECNELEDKIRQVKEAKEFEPIEKDDDIYTIKQFIDMCKGGGFIDYDGFGVYAFEDKKSDIHVYPSDVQKGIIRNDFTHVVWYNR